MQGAKSNDSSDGYYTVEKINRPLGITLRMGMSNHELKDERQCGVHFYWRDRLVETYSQLGVMLNQDTGPQCAKQGLIGVVLNSEMLQPLNTKQGFETTGLYGHVCQWVAQELSEMWHGQSVRKNWVQCDQCTKWRTITDKENMPGPQEKWTCSKHPDRITCGTPLRFEEQDQKADNEDILNFQSHNAPTGLTAIKDVDSSTYKICSPIVDRVCTAEYESQEVVVKCLLRRSEASTAEQNLHLMTALKQSESINDNHVVRVFFVDYKAGAIGMESGGKSLLSILRDDDEQTFSLMRRLEIAAGISLGIEKLHKSSIVHGRLDPSHVLVDNSSGQVKIISWDLGEPWSKSTASQKVYYNSCKKSKTAADDIFR